MREKFYASCRFYGRLSHEGPRPMTGLPSVGEGGRGVSERLGRQVRPGIEPATSRLPVLSSESLSHW